MIRSLTIACLLIGLSVSGCTGNSREAPDPGGYKQDAPKVDPMIFVLVYRPQIEAILKKHTQETTDCEAALAELLRFVADNKQRFCDRVKDKPAGWQPEGLSTDGPVEPLMEYSENCPEQVVRLNQAIRSVLE
jgi:hypothetical protein